MKTRMDVGRWISICRSSFCEASWDAAAKARVEQFFPNREVVVIDARELWYNGGGIHCVTNDQPLLRQPTQLVIRQNQRIVAESHSTIDDVFSKQRLWGWF